jgi:hypothetical protein
MNNAGQIATLLYSTGGLVALWVVAVCWCGYKTDKLRQDVFHLRAELFDYAASGAVSFSDASYIRLRTILNSMIRLAHEVSFIRVVVTVILERFRPMIRELPNFMETLEADSCISYEAREKLKSIHIRLVKLVFWKIVTTSLVALPVLVVVFLSDVLRHGLPKKPMVKPLPTEQILLDRRLNYHIQLIEQQAIETRESKLQQQRRFVAAGVR